MTGTVLHVQSVLYRNDEREIARMAEGLRTACRHAANEGMITSARLHLGDCSPTPCLGADAVAALTEPGADGAGISIVDDAKLARRSAGALQPRGGRCGFFSRGSMPASRYGSSQPCPASGQASTLGR